MAEPDPMEQVEAAIMTRLGLDPNTGLSTDGELAPLLPGGLHSRTAPSDNSQFPFLTLTLVTMTSDYTFRAPWRHVFQYGVGVTDDQEAVDRATAALERVYDLLQDVTVAQFPMEDFTVMFSRRQSRSNVTPNQAGVTYQRITDNYRIEITPKP